MGGGLASIAPTSEQKNQTLELPDVNEYCDAVQHGLASFLSRCSETPTLFFEPGRTIFEPFGATLSTVLGIRPKRGETNAAVICDSGITSIPLAAQFEFPIHTTSQHIDSMGDDSARDDSVHDDFESYDFFGPTCMQRDQLAKSRLAPQLEVGDNVIFYGTGGYNIALASSFINYRPGIVLWDSADNFQWIRKPETFQSASQIHLADFVD